MSDEVRNTARRRKLFLVCDEVGLSTEGRLALAEMLLRHDISSFKELSDEQVIRLLDAIEGFQLISELKRQEA